MFTLDYRSRLPIYEQLYKDITRKAALGAIEQGEPLPSVRSLAQELGVNPNTVQKAYQMLEHDGIICSVPGKGSFLSGDVSAISQQREIAAEKLNEALQTAADCGIPKAEVLTQVNDIFNGRSA
ncbi:MAG: GntR family transcriptional regulator [Caproiciproducens sp.]|nr:GntR family transcriptional regulator [Caproiciproducens sp.]